MQLMSKQEYLVTFDSGPGQIMLKAKSFFAAMANQVTPPKYTIKQKVERLVEMLEDGERRLAENRKRDLADYRQKAQTYTRLTHHRVTPESQAALNLK